MAKRRADLWELLLIICAISLLAIATTSLLIKPIFLSDMGKDDMLSNIDSITLGLIAVGIFISLANWLRFYKQSEKQDETSSMNFILKIKSIEESGFIYVADKIQKCKFNEVNDKALINRFLIYLNMVAYMHEKDLIEIDDIKHVYGSLLRRIKDDDDVKKLINNEDRYAELKKLCNKI